MSARELDANGWLTRSLRHSRRIAAVQERYVSLRNDPLREVVVAEPVVQSSPKHLHVNFSWIVWLRFSISWLILMPVSTRTTASRRHTLARDGQSNQLLVLERLRH